MNAKLFFSADYRDGRVRIGSKTYSAGYYCVHLLNQYYKDDTAARLSVFTNRNWQLQEQLKAGYLNADDFAKAGEEICNIFHVLPWLKPFDALDIKAERNRVTNLFTSENAEMLISCMMEPMQDRVAIPEPEIAPKIPQATVIAIPRPPLIRPTNISTRLTRHSPMPPFSIRLPAKMNRGMDIRMMELHCL